MTGVLATAYSLRARHLKKREVGLLTLKNEKTTMLREGERQVRRSREELDIRVQERNH